MCMHMKEDTVKRLRKVFKKLEMSFVSKCLECIRMGRDNRYVRR